MARRPSGPDRIPTRLRDEGGIALAVAIFALVVLAAIVAGGYYSAGQEYQIGRAMKSVTASFYAAEVGIAELVNGWEPATYNAMLPGDTLPLGPLVLEGGARFSAIAVRVDDDSNPLKRYFYLESVGTPPVGLGERRQAAAARTRFHDQICCNAAMKILGSIDTVSAPTEPRISGFDQIPAVWPPSTCTEFPLIDVAGVIVEEVDSIGLDPGQIEGNPSIVEDTFMTAASLFTFADLTYDDIAQIANHQLDGSVNPKVQPSLDAGGECDRSDPNNWGAPEDPNHPCFDYFPIIHITNGVELTGNRAGQGILLMDADITLTSPFRFYGILLMQDDLELNAQSQVFGGALVGGDFKIQGNKPRVYYSQCAVKRAVRLSRLANGHLLPRRAWVEILK